MTCAKEQGGDTDEDTRIRTRSWVQETDQGGLLEMSGGVTFWLTAQTGGERFWTYSEDCPLLRVKGELTAPPILASHRFPLYLLMGHLPYAISYLCMSDATGPDLPGVLHSSGLWKTELAHAPSGLQTVSASPKSSLVPHLSPFPRWSIYLLTKSGPSPPDIQSASTVAAKLSQHIVKKLYEHYLDILVLINLLTFTLHTISNVKPLSPSHRHSTSLTPSPSNTKSLFSQAGQQNRRFFVLLSPATMETEAVRNWLKIQKIKSRQNSPTFRTFKTHLSLPQITQKGFRLTTRWY